MTSETWPLQQAEDVVRFRQAVHRVVREMGFRLIDQTKFVTAASELARNAVEHGGGGNGSIESVRSGTRSGIQVKVEDRGPGIGNLDQALRDGYTGKNGMGLGLGGAKRLSDTFEIRSAPGEGTSVTIVRWL